MSYIGNIESQARVNINFREVVFTGELSQLVIMSIAPSSEVGEEAHSHVEQTLYIVDGVCDVILDGVTSVVKKGDVIVVTPGCHHNFINNGSEAVKIITTYSPPNHLDKRVHVTLQDASNDIEDEAFSDEVNTTN